MEQKKENRYWRFILDAKIKNFRFFWEVLPALFILFLWFAFEEKFIHYFDLELFPILAAFKSSYVVTALFVLIVLPLFGFFCYKIIKRDCQKSFLVFIQVVWILIALSFIYVYSRFNTDYLSVQSSLYFGYSDITMLLLIALLLIYLRNTYVFAYLRNDKEDKIEEHEAKNDSQCVFIPDVPISDEKDDVLNFNDDARKLALQLQLIDRNCFFSVGITAPWGSGKTSYMNLIESNLDKDKTIIVKFNPRHSKNIDSIQKDFFRELISRLCKYNLNSYFVFNDYLKSINVVNENRFISFLFALYKVSVLDKKTEVNKVDELIRSINRKIFIFIEDFDRLTREEIFEVLKLIDGNASFKNVVFITAYDKQNINCLIGNEYSNKNVCFFDKFFNVELKVPFRQYDDVLNYIKESIEIKLENLDAVDLKIIDKHKLIIKDHIVNLRDAKRFISLFVNQYKNVEKEVVFEDFFLLTIIRVKHYDEYLMLYNKIFFKDYPKESKYHRLTIKEKYLINDEKGNADIVDDEKQKLKSINIINALFSESREKKKNFRISINCNISFYTYFYEDVFDHLKNVQLMELTENDNCIDKIIEYIYKGHLEEIITYYLNINGNEYDTIEQFKRFVEILFFINNENDENLNIVKKQKEVLVIIMNLITDDYSVPLIKKYRLDSSRYVNLIVNTLIKVCFESHENVVVGNILRNLYVKNTDYSKCIIKKTDLLGISIASLADRLNIDGRVTEDNIHCLHNCISGKIEYNEEHSDINDGVIGGFYLDKKSCETVRKMIEVDPTGYLNYFIRSNSSNMTCDKYRKQLFGSEANVEAFLFDKEKDNIILEKNDEDTFDIDYIRAFWNLFKRSNYQFFDNSFKSVEKERQKIKDKRMMMGM